jgi:micrococcal nuclease
VFLLLVPVSDAAVSARSPHATVTHVTDGDTAYLKPLRYGETVGSWSGRSARFIGVDTPEVYGTDECFGPQASAFTTRKLEGSHVRVAYGKDPVDPYGRALVYIWHKGHLFNAALIRRGFARASFYAPNYRFRSWFLRLEKKARAAERGLWGACR